MARKITDLHPRLQAKIDILRFECAKKAKTKKLMITECVRSVKEQDALYALGRTKPGKIVTKVSGKDYNSMHQWGVAVDFCKADKDDAFSDAKFFTEVGKVAESIGLDWGGNWISFKDTPHLQLKGYGSTPNARLKKCFKTPKDFRATWPCYKGKYKTTKNVSFRACPGTCYPKVGTGTIPTGTALSADGVFDCSKAGYIWLRVKYKGTVGYVCMTHLKRL